MKKIFITILYIITFTMTGIGSANRFAGNWEGSLKVSGISLRIVLIITENQDGNLKAVMKSPDQTDKEIPVDTVIINDDSIRCNIEMIKGFFAGKLINDTTLSGVWSQVGMNFPLEFHKRDKPIVTSRPQEPKKPYPYKEEEITFENKQADITLSGTFTYPENGENFPVVVLISGSGPQDRNEALLGHKPFLVLSDHLTRNGIAVLRFDDRGVGDSKGNFSTATTMDFTSDVIAAVDYLKTRKEVDQKQIGLIGHSEGGLIAPLASVQSEDIDFIVLMAGPGISGKDILILQSRLIGQADGKDLATLNKSQDLNEKVFSIIDNEKDSSTAANNLKTFMDDYYETLSDSEKAMPEYSLDLLHKQVAALLSPWFRFFVQYDPAETLSKVKVPILAINGQKDLQVPPKENLSAIEKWTSKGGNKNVKTIELKGLNHLFQTSKTGSPSEYNKIEETISPEAMTIISTWIKEQTKRNVK